MIGCKMKKLCILLFAFSMPLMNGCMSAVTPSVAHAQNETTPDEPIVELEETEYTLAPLEEVQLEMPQLSTGSRGERQVWLGEGDLAPWDGVLLNPPAAAFIISQYQALHQRAMAALERQRDSDANRLNFEVGRLQLRLTTERLAFVVELEGRDREITRVREAHQALIDQNNDNFLEVLEDFLMITIPGVVGIAIGILIGFFAVGG